MILPYLDTWCMHNRLKSLNFGGCIEVFKGVVLVIKSKQGLRNGLKLKKNLGVLSSTFRKEVVPRMARLLVPRMARNIIMSVYWVPTAYLVVVRNDIRWR